MIPEALRTLWAAPPAPGAPARVWRDWVLIGLVAVGAVLEVVLRDDVVWPAVVLPLTIALSATLLWRRTHALAAVTTVFGAALILDLIAFATGVDESVGLGAMAFVLVLFYALWRWGSGRDVILGSAVTLVVATLGMVRSWTNLSEGIAGFVFLCSPAVIGLLVRLGASSRVRRLDDVRVREREQLARELHDTVAHHVSAIVVRAQAGRVVAATDPTAATEALTLIEQEGARTLAEMRVLVGALRGSAPAELAPTRGARDVPELAAADERVVVELPDDVDLGPALGGAVYRIAQESVTNALRHARGATKIVVAIAADDDAVRCTVTDDGQPSPRGAGYGIVGMTERAALVGGTLVAGPVPTGGWEVTAVLPRRGARA